jgi:hypothetical protein
MTTESTHTINRNGRTISATATQTGGNILTIVTVDGKLYSQETQKAMDGWTSAEVEAQTEAERVAGELEQEVK